MGRLGRKMIVCLCDRNADVFEVRMNLYGFYAAVITQASDNGSFSSDFGPFQGLKIGVSSGCL